MSHKEEWGQHMQLWLPTEIFDNSSFDSDAHSTAPVVVVVVAFCEIVAA